MTYPETVKYLESFVNYEKIPAYPYQESLKLERVKGFLQVIGNPQESLRCVHVAGTKGKGSTCAFVSYILRAAGYKVGLYTSPHLSDFRERIRVLSQKEKCEVFTGIISKKDLSGLTGRLHGAIESYNRKSIYGPLTFFEVYTSLAFLYFKEKKVDFAVLETGLGGRLDATNAVNSLVAAITPISLEHTDKLGDTLKEIAGEKAGIIKTKDSIVISAPQAGEAAAVIRRRCKEKGVKLYEVGKDYKIQGNSRALKIKGVLGEYNNLKVPLLGRHQLINAAVAVGIIEALILRGNRVPKKAIRDGLKQAAWPGRCEVISKNPLVVLDGAQNTASARVIRQAVKENFKYKKLILVFGISRDKDIKGVCRELHDFTDEIILTMADTLRACPTDLIARFFNGKKMHFTKSVPEAKKMAYRIAGAQDLILVTGSLFVVGEFRG